MCGLGRIGALCPTWAPGDSCEREPGYPTTTRTLPAKRRMPNLSRRTTAAIAGGDHHARLAAGWTVGDVPHEAMGLPEAWAWPPASSSPLA